MKVTTKDAGQAAISSVFFFSAAFLLWFTAVTSYLVFYFSFIPIRGFSLPLFIQFEEARNLYASVQLPSGNLVSNQPYDVNLHLSLPRTPANIAAGNFMLDLQLLRPPSSTWTKAAADLPDLIASERRPAILTYHSPLIRYAKNVVALPLYVLGWRRETEKMVVPLMEGVEFARGSQSIPTQAKVEIMSSAQLQIYNAKLSFRTQLQGLRYLMYNYRLTSFIVFTSIFWGVEMFFAAAAWWISTTYLTSRPGQEPAVKGELDDIPTKEEEQPSEAVKKEEEQPKSLYEYPPAAEADDEDDEIASHSLIGTGYLRVSDSGIGTSMDSGEPIRRRTKPS